MRCLYHFKRVFSLLLFVLMSSAIGFAQVFVKGTIFDSNGETIPGANIQVKGENKGTISDFDGKFSLGVSKKDAVLIVSFIGYKTQEVKADPSRIMSIVLREDSKMIDEVVVVGYEEVKKRDLTGAVSQVNMNNLLNVPSSSFDQTLGGRVAGVNVTSAEGQPGGQMNIVIRGNNSLTQDNSPLYVVDGFPVEDPSIASTINPSDIESIDILKDASAASIYGSRGANGVVIITTRKGKIGKPQLSYDGSFGVQQITSTIPLMDAYEYVRLQQEINYNTADRDYMIRYDESGNELTDDAGNVLRHNLDYYKTAPQYDWQDMVFRTAWQQRHNVNLMGGNEGIRYNASASYFDQDGILLNSDYEQFQTRLNTVIKTGKWDVNVAANFTRISQTGSSPSQSSYSGMNNLFSNVWGYRPINRSYESLESLLLNPLDAAVDGTVDYRFNPVLDLKNAYRKNYTNNLRLNGAVTYEFMKGLRLKVSGGYTLDFRTSDQFYNSSTRYGGPTSSDKVNGQISRNQRITWLNENVLSYQVNIKRKHAINSLVGVTFQNSDYENYGFKTINIPNEDLGLAGLEQGTPSTTTSLRSSWSMMSYLASANYSYRWKYYAKVSFRADGSSKFSPKNRFGYFPSASLAWNFTQEKFMQPLKSVLGTGKLRLSWGLTGNNKVQEYAYWGIMDMLKSNTGFTSAGANSSTVYPFDNNMTSVGTAPTSILNEELTWETTEQWNAGMDLAFFDKRIELTFDWYSKVTRDLLLNATLPQHTGYFSAMKNIGKVKNYGIELTLNTVNLERRGFKWSTNFNIAFNRNKVLELSENQSSLLSTVSFDQAYNSQPTYIAKVGKPMGMMYGYIYEGTYKYDDFYNVGGTYTLKENVPYFSGESNTQPGMPKYKDLNGDGVIDAGDRTIIGRGHPIHTGGFTNDFSYRGFDLSVFFQWSYGNDIFNANRLFFENPNGKICYNQFASYIDRWTPQNPESDIPAAYQSSSNQVVSSRVIEDGSFLRLKTVTLGYTLPISLTKSWHMSNVRFYVAAQNLWTLTNYSGYDPEVSVRNSSLTPGLDFSSYPRAISMNFGVNIKF